MNRLIINQMCKKKLANEETIDQLSMGPNLTRFTFSFGYGRSIICDELPICTKVLHRRRDFSTLSRKLHRRHTHSSHVFSNDFSTGRIHSRNMAYRKRRWPTFTSQLAAGKCRRAFKILRHATDMSFDELTISSSHTPCS